MRETRFIAWISRLVRAQRESLLRVARREGLTAEDAHDAVQEALQAFLDLPAARGFAGRDDEARKLLSALVRNVARNSRRRHHRARDHQALSLVEPDGGPTAEEWLALAQKCVHMCGCIHKLGHLQRSVLTLRLLEGRDGREVARALKLTPGHVAVLLHRARAELKECIANAGAAHMA